MYQVIETSLSDRREIKASCWTLDAATKSAASHAKLAAKGSVVEVVEGSYSHLAFENRGGKVVVAW